MGIRRPSALPVARSALRADLRTLTVVLAKWQPGPDLPALAHIVLERATFERRANTTVLQAPSAAHAGLQYADYLAFASHRQRTRGEERWLNATRMPARAYSDFTAF